jgi:3',5'-cyclic-AMP phosphodiesterase
MSGRIPTAHRFMAAIDAIAASLDKYRDIDAVIVTGDVAEDGDPTSYAHFRTEIERLNLDYFVIPGNHDHRENMRRSFGDLGYMPKSGPLSWSREFADFHLVGLDTLIPGQGGGVLDVQSLAFLASAIETSNAKPVLIAMHHPPFQCGVHFMDRIGLNNAAALAEVLAGAQVEVRVICGHLHCMNVSMVGGSVAISAPSTANVFPVDYRADASVGFMTQSGGYMLHDWDGGFKSTYVEIADGTGPHPF